MEPDKYQKEVINHSLSPDDDVFVMASAGSGKTFSMQQRITYLLDKGVNPRSIIAVSFTKKSSEELSKRIKKANPSKGGDVRASTFHSLGYSILDDNFKVDGVLPPFKASQVIHRFLIEENWSKEEKPIYIYDLIGRAKMNATDKDEFEAFFIREEGEDGVKINKVFERYETHKASSNEIDFHDMLYDSWTILRDSESLRRSYGANFMIVDECQDLNSLQYKISDLLTESGQLTLIGDPAQMIYSFRGASQDKLFDFKESRGMNEKYLKNNYRSSRKIIEKSNSLIESSSLSGDCPKSEPVRDEVGNIDCLMVSDEVKEAEVVSKKISNLLEEGESPEDIAIIYRVNAQSQYLEMELEDREIPYYVNSTHGFFDRSEVQNCIAYLRLVADEYNLKALKQVYNTPTRYLGRQFWSVLKRKYNTNDTVMKALYRAKSSYKSSKPVRWLINDIQDLRLIGKDNPEKTVDAIFGIHSRLDKSKSFYDLQKGEDDEDSYRTENLDTLKNMASRFDDIDNFLKNIEYRINNEDKTPEGKVQLMTTHKCKGLEFKNVFVAGFADRFFPHKDGDPEEEKRIAYVAITRAEDYLNITVPSRIYNESVSFSPFLKDMGIKPKIVD